MGSSHSQQSAHDPVSVWSSRPEHDLIFDSGSHKIDQYLEAVARLHPMDDHRIEVAMRRLQSEFHTVLSRQSDAPPSTNSVVDSSSYTSWYEDYPISDLPSYDVITYLRRIAEQMNCSGMIGKCVEVYQKVRKPYLTEKLKPLRFQEFKKSRTRLSLDEWKVKMEMWSQVSKICIRILFDQEKQICDKIFGGCGAVKDECFIGTVHDFADSLFGFVEAVSLRKHQHKRMDTVFTVYKTFLTVLPGVDTLFGSDQGKKIKDTCHETLARIESDVERMLHEFEHDLVHEKVGMSNDDACGGVDRTTKYVTDRIELIAHNRQLIKCEPSSSLVRVIHREEMGDVSDYSFIQRHLILILVVLQINIQSKAKAYKNATLGHTFSMNNLHHVIQKVEASPTLEQMIGEAHVNKLNANFKRAMTDYQTWFCNMFLHCFRDRGLRVNWSRKQLSCTVMQKRLTDFNALCENLEMGSQWTIPDPSLREKVRAQVRDTLVPSYQSFLDMFSTNSQLVSILKNNTKYSAEAFRALIMDKLFADNLEVE